MKNKSCLLFGFLCVSGRDVCESRVYGIGQSKWGGDVESMLLETEDVV